MPEENLEKTIEACKVCNSIKRRDTWYQIGKEQLQKLSKEYEIKEAYCSSDCFTKYLTEDAYQ